MIRSTLDTDLYKITMQAAVLQLYPNLKVQYAFNNRRPSNVFNSKAVLWIKQQVKAMEKLRTSEKEIAWLRENCPFLPEWYFPAFQAYRFNSNEVDIQHSDGVLDIQIEGLWWRTILWEVPLMAIISEAYFKFVDKNWTENGQQAKLEDKALKFKRSVCKVSDMGTRRRRSYASQKRVVETFMEFPEFFVGTSNPHFAMKYGVKPMGTMAHEWIMAHQVIAGLRRCNLAAMTAWQQVYKGKLGIALPDTVGSDAFFEDMRVAQPVDLARLFDGVRHDSGDWKVFANRVIGFYKNIGIDPKSKTIIFSDGLNTDLACEIARFCKHKIKCAFGIGTHFTNDYDGSPALNMVIKLKSVYWNERWIPVVKISDSPSKAIGDFDALRVAYWTFHGKALDSRQ